MNEKGSIQLGGIFWMALGAILSLSSIRLKLGTLHSPGAGFTPFLTGLLLALFGLMLTLESVKGTEPRGEGLVVALRGFGRKRTCSLLAVCLYAALLETLGFIITTFLLLFGLFKIIEPRKWLAPLLVSVIAVILSYFIFEVWLRINFPKGIFRIG